MSNFFENTEQKDGKYILKIDELILFDLDNFNINDFNPESIIVELYKKAINHRNYKLSKILELC